MPSKLRLLLGVTDAPEAQPDFSHLVRPAVLMLVIVGILSLGQGAFLVPGHPLVPWYKTLIDELFLAHLHYYMATTGVFIFGSAYLVKSVQGIHSPAAQLLLLFSIDCWALLATFAGAACGMALGFSLAEAFRPEIVPDVGKIADLYLLALALAMMCWLPAVSADCIWNGVRRISLQQLLIIFLVSSSIAAIFRKDGQGALFMTLALLSTGAGALALLNIKSHRS